MPAARAGTRAEGRASLDGRARDPGQCQRRLGQGIGCITLLRLAEDPATPQQPQDARPDGGEQPADLRVGGGRGWVEAKAPIGRLGEHPVN